MTVAIITGADSGIGKATAVALADAGHDVGIHYRSDEQGAAQAAEEVRQRGRAAAVEQADLTDLDASVEVFDHLVTELGGIDVLVNNAGRGVSTPFLEQGLDEWQDTLRVDLTAAFLLGQRAANVMVEAGAGGRIINVTSVHEHVPKRSAAAYCAAKGGLGLLTKVMALELAEHGILVNAIAPGEISTPMTGQHEQDPHEQERPGTPLGRPGDAHEIAAMIACLAAPGASYATGSSFIVDGGLLLMAAHANG